MIVKLGELFDKLQAITDQMKEVERAELSILHGGGPDTMRGKHEILAFAKEMLKDMRNEELDDTL